MKKKTLKLFLIFGLILLSLFALSSCEETPDVPPTPPENTNLEAIEDIELLEFIFTSPDTRHPRPNYYIEPISLVDLYTYSKREDISLLELYAKEKYEIIAAYIPSDARELIFSVDEECYFEEKCNVWGFAELMHFLEEKEIAWSAIGLKAYFVTGDKVPLKNGNSDLVFVGTHLSLFNNGLEYRKHVRPVLFNKGNGGFAEIKFDNEYFLGKRFISVENGFDYKIANEEMLCARIVYIEKLGERDVVKENLAEINSSLYGNEFKELFASALIKVTGNEEVDNEFIVIERIYDYLKIKEILEIK